MHFKLIIAFVDDRKTEAVTRAAREAGATGITAISSARGEGIMPQKTFLGLSLEDQRDVLLLMGEEHMARHILETICEAGEFESDEACEERRDHVSLRAGGLPARCRGLRPH